MCRFVVFLACVCESSQAWRALRKAATHTPRKEGGRRKEEEGANGEELATQGGTMRLVRAGGRCMDKRRLVNYSGGLALPVILLPFAFCLFDCWSSFQAWSREADAKQSPVEELVQRQQQKKQTGVVCAWLLGCGCSVPAGSGHDRRDGGMEILTE